MLMAPCGRALRVRCWLVHRDGVLRATLLGLAYLPHRKLI